MRVLAFDPGTETGWASFANARSLPVLGTLELPHGPEHQAHRNLALLKAARALIREHAPDVVAYESVIFTPRDSWHERRLLCGLADMIELAALAEGDRRCIEVPPLTVKTALAGWTKARKDDQVVAAVRLGWTVASHHQADAGGVALATYGYLQQRHQQGA